MHEHEWDSLYDRKFSWGVSLQLLKVTNCRKVEMDVVCLEVAPPQLALDPILAMWGQSTKEVIKKGFMDLVQGILATAHYNHIIETQDILFLKPKIPAAALQDSKCQKTMQL